MNWIVAKNILSDGIIKIEIQAPEIALLCKPGHHIIIKVVKDSERIPLVVSAVNSKKGTVSLYVHKKGDKHRSIANLMVGDEIDSIEGPCGESISIDNYGTVICAAGGVGISPLFPIVVALKNAGNKVITVLGARNKEFIILEKEFLKYSDELIIFTDDGSCGKEGLVTEGIFDILNREKVQRVYSIGPTRMIKHSSLLTRRYNIPLIATLYSLCVDGIGLNGIYNVSISGQSKYICVDGCNFNAYYTDFDIMISKMEAKLKEGYAGNQNYSSKVNIEL